MLSQQHQADVYVKPDDHVTQHGLRMWSSHGHGHFVYNFSKLNFNQNQFKLKILFIVRFKLYFLIPDVQCVLRFWSPLYIYVSVCVRDQYGKEKSRKKDANNLWSVCRETYGVKQCLISDLWPLSLRRTLLTWISYYNTPVLNWAFDLSRSVIFHHAHVPLHMLAQ